MANGHKTQQTCKLQIIIQGPQVRSHPAYQAISSLPYTDCYLALYIAVKYKADVRICNRKTTQSGHNKKGEKQSKV
jgi:hypothetical protein